MVRPHQRPTIVGTFAQRQLGGLLGRDMVGRRDTVSGAKGVGGAVGQVEPIAENRG